MPLDWITDMATAQTRQGTIQLLRAQCERCIECLNNLTVIHLELDSPSRVIKLTDDACYYRLRKVLLHVEAIAGWQIETEVLHVIAPEVRCANTQLEKVLVSMPESFRLNYLGEKNSAFAGKFRQVGKGLREIVSGFVHPTPQRLLLPIEHGGFYETNKAPNLVFMFWMLVDLASKYAVSVAYLSDNSKTGNEWEVTTVILRLESAVTAVGGLSFDEIFKAG